MFLTTNTILYCRRWRETVAFYRDRLGLPISFESDWLIEFQASKTGYLSVADERRARMRSASGAGVTITLRVKSAEDTRTRLQAAGVDVGPVQSHPWGARLFRFRDPEGHRLEVWSPDE